MNKKIDEVRIATLDYNNNLVLTRNNIHTVKEDNADTEEDNKEGEDDDNSYEEPEENMTVKQYLDKYGDMAIVTNDKLFVANKKLNAIGGAIKKAKLVKQVGFL